MWKKTLMPKVLIPVMACLYSLSIFANIPTMSFPSLDYYQVAKQEQSIERKGEAPRYAIPHEVQLNAQQKQMNWQIQGDVAVWKHRFQAPKSKSLNFGFDQFYLPQGAELKIYSRDFRQQMRTITSEDNKAHGEFWSPVIEADDVIMELTAPVESISQVKFNLIHVGQGFRTFGTPRTSRSGSCNRDVSCEEAQGWEKEINAVGVISTGGSRFCSGFMVNNTAQDRAPLFMTANHCRINASSAARLVVYWNYQRSECGNRRVNGSLDQWQSGSTLLASGRISDFTLVRLDESPKEEWNVSYAGWDRRGINATTSVAIHHPRVSEKSISFSHRETALTTYLGRNELPGDEATHVMVEDWDTGTTEPGSSGSPLFDQDHRVIGQLHGGYAACGNDREDWYGRFAYSWDAGENDEDRLAPHLDPVESGLEFIDSIQ